MSQNHAPILSPDDYKLINTAGLNKRVARNDFQSLSGTINSLHICKSKTRIQYKGAVLPV